MKHFVVSFLSVWLLTGCAELEDRRREREVTPQHVGSDYTFKTWPGSTTTYALTLQGVRDVSATLGPDFTVHYFTFVQDASLALYNGGHPHGSDEIAATRFLAPFGSKRTEWRLTRRETDFRAEGYIPDGDHSVWHVIVIAPTEQRVREVIGQLRTFSQHDKPITKTTANKTEAGNGSNGICRVIDASCSPSSDPKC